MSTNEESIIQGFIPIPEISGATLIFDRWLLVASDEKDMNGNNIFLIDQAIPRLQNGEIGQERTSVRKLDIAIEDPEDVTWDSENHCAYVITSHSRNKRGKVDKNRYCLARLEFDADGNMVEVLREDWLFWEILEKVPCLAEAMLRTPAQGGLNIEGLEYSPKSGELLVGVRSPTVTNGEAPQKEAPEQALLLRIKHADAIFEDPDKANDDKNDDKQAKLAKGQGQQKMVRLDLDGQGIRGLCYDRALEKHWILSNMSVDPNQDLESAWGLWLWDGEGVPKRYWLPGGVKLKNPEAISWLKVNGKPHLLLVEDAKPMSPYVLVPTKRLVPT